MRRKVMITFICTMMILSTSVSITQNVGEPENVGQPQNNGQPSPTSGGSGGLANSPWPMFRGNLKHNGQSLYDTSRNNGQLKWNFKSSDTYSSPAIGSDGTVYVGSDAQRLYAINSDGIEKWSLKTDHHIESSPAIESDGTIYVGSQDHKLYAINPDGTKKWSFTTGYDVISSPAIGSDGTIYVGSDDNKLYAINPDGTEKWSFTTGANVGSSPAVDFDGTIYVGSGDFKLYAINPDGTEKWSFATGSGVHTSPAIGFDGTIYIGSFDNKLYAINPDGTEKWSFTTANHVISSPAIGFDGTIYIGSWDTNLYAINPDGTKKWNFGTGEPIRSSPAIGAEGTIYIGTGMMHNSSAVYYLYAINPDGTKKWSFASSARVRSSPAIGFDGTIYVGSDHGLYAIGTSNIPPTATAGPDQTINEGDLVQFDGSASYDPESTISTYEWDFDSTDGLWWETGAAPDSTDIAPTYVYGDDGIYTVTLRVTDDIGASDTDTCIVTINNVAPILEENLSEGVNEEWIRRYKRTTNGLDIAYDILVGPHRNIYVFGNSRGAGTGIDYVIIKYDSDGNELWVARYNGPENMDDHGTDMVVDSSGNVFVTGYTGDEYGKHKNYTTVAYDSDGNRLWAASYDGPANSQDEAWAITVDSSGNVYVTGFSRGENPHNYDIATIAYDLLGNQLWVTRYGLANASDIAYDIALDTSGNVFVTGGVQYINPYIDRDYLTVAYDSSGNKLWAKLYNGPGDGYDCARKIDIGPEGNIYVIGDSYGGYPNYGGTDYDYATIAYDSNGNELWVARYNGPGNGDDFPRELTIDNYGNVYVSGFSEGNGTHKDMAIVAYDSNGNQLWVARYNGPANKGDYDGDLTTDSLGNIYITGWSHNGNNFDYLTAAYSPLGHQLWTTRYNGPINSLDYPYGIAVDPSGNVYVTGKSHVTGMGGMTEEKYDIITIKYSPPTYYACEEGSPIAFTANATDPGSDDLTFIWDWGDGTPNTITTYHNSGINPEPFYNPSNNEIKSPWGIYPFTATNTVSHTYGDDGIYTITLTIQDDDGGITVTTINVTVVNVVPTIDLYGPFSDDEGSPLYFLGISSDPGSDDLIFTWEFEFGPTISNNYYNDGATPDLYPSPMGNYPFSAFDMVEHTYGDDGNYSIVLTVTDDDGGVAVYETYVLVNNVPPTITSMNHTILFVNKPRTIGYWGHQCEVEEPYGDHTGILQEWIDEISLESQVFSWISTKEDVESIVQTGDAEDMVVMARRQLMGLWLNIVSDKLNLASEINMPNLTSSNTVWEAVQEIEYVVLHSNDRSELERVKDIADNINNGRGIALAYLEFEATATDPGADDLTFHWDFGDGNSQDNFYPNVSGTFPVEVTDYIGHSYFTLGTFNVTLVVTDDDGGTTTTFLEIVIS